MHYRGAGVEAEQNVFRSSVDGAHGLTADGGFEVAGDGPAQPAIAHDDIDDAPLQQATRNAAPGRFYFGELGRETARAMVKLFDFRFFVGDVFTHDRIEFLGFEFVRMQPLVLGRRVVMPGSGRGHQFDFVAHQ
jgi:hypothetical protein